MKIGLERTTIWMLINSCVTITALTLSLIGLTKSEPQVYVNVSELFNEFKLSKQLKSDLMNSQSARENILDSLELRIKGSGSMSDNDRTRLITEYRSLREEFEIQNQQQTSEYDQRIWSQLNQLVQEYGHQQGYTIIFGANGQGSVMYGSDKKDVTQSLIAYINEQYERI